MPTHGFNAHKTLIFSDIPDGLSRIFAGTKFYTQSSFANVKDRAHLSGEFSKLFLRGIILQLALDGLPAAFLTNYSR